MLVKRYQGQVVKRMRRVSGGILLTFLSERSGDRGQQITITQADWNRHGSQSYERTTLAALRQQQPT